MIKMTGEKITRLWRTTRDLNEYTAAVEQFVSQEKDKRISELEKVCGSYRREIETNDDLMQPQQVEQSQDKCEGCNGRGLVGNIHQTDECPFCSGTGTHHEKVEQSHAQVRDAALEEAAEAYMNPFIISFKDAIRTSCPEHLQAAIEGTVSWGEPSLLGDSPDVVDKFGVTHSPKPLYFAAPARNPVQEPTLYQYRTKPSWLKVWDKWEDCSIESFNDYIKYPTVNDLDHEVRALYTSPQPAPFPERDTTKSAEQQGVFRKFEVRRMDGSDVPGGKHHGCRYFVLDLDHDKHAPAAMRSYGIACAETYPQLSVELLAKCPPQPAPAGPQAFDAQRLRNVVRLLGLADAVPSSDDDLIGCLGSVLGMVYRKIVDLQTAPASKQEIVAWMRPSTEGYDSAFRDASTVEICTGTDWVKDGWIPLCRCDQQEKKDV